MLEETEVKLEHEVTDVQGGHDTFEVKLEHDVILGVEIGYTKLVVQLGMEVTDVNVESVDLELKLRHSPLEVKLGEETLAGKLEHEATDDDIPG